MSVIPKEEQKVLKDMLDIMVESEDEQDRAMARHTVDFILNGLVEPSAAAPAGCGCGLKEFIQARSKTRLGEPYAVQSGGQEVQVTTIGPPPAVAAAMSKPVQ